MTPEHRAALRLAVDARRRELVEAPADGIIHGEASYRRGCRCDRCKQAANVNRRRRLEAMAPDARRAMWRAQAARRKLRLAAEAIDNQDVRGRIVAA